MYNFYVLLLFVKLLGSFSRFNLSVAFLYFCLLNTRKYKTFCISQDRLKVVNAHTYIYIYVYIHIFPDESTNSAKKILS